MKVNTNVPGYVKDTRSGAVLATDLSGYHAILESRKNKQLQGRVEALETEVASLRTVVNQLLLEIAK